MNPFKGRPLYTWFFGGLVCFVGALCLLAWFRPDPSAIAAPKPETTEPASDPSPAAKASPSFADLVGDIAFAPLKSNKIITASAVLDPPIPAPLATVAAAEASAPQSPSPCEITVRRLAGATRAPVRESIFDDIEAKYELIRVNDNQRFLAIKSACVKRGPSKRG